MADILSGAAVLAFLVSLSWGVARMEVRRQLGADYRNFIEHIRRLNRQAGGGE